MVDIRFGLGRFANAHVALDASGIVRQTGVVREEFQTKYKTALAFAHEEFAVQVQEQAVEIVRQRVQETGREQTGKQRLERSIMDDRNRTVNASGFAVGREAWMNRSPARMYWRALEVGGKPYTTKVAFFRGAGGQSRPGANTTDVQMVQITGFFRAKSRLKEIEISGTPDYAYFDGAADWFNALPDGVLLRTYQKHFKQAGMGTIAQKTFRSF